mgnify:CR=1 FL=1
MRSANTLGLMGKSIEVCLEREERMRMTCIVSCTHTVPFNSLDVVLCWVLWACSVRWTGCDGVADSFKIVYVAPMKALAAEMVANFSKRLSSLGIVVKEYTGD